MYSISPANDETQSTHKNTMDPRIACCNNNMCVPRGRPGSVVAGSTSIPQGAPRTERSLLRLQRLVRDTCSYLLPPFGSASSRNEHKCKDWGNPLLLEHMTCRPRGKLIIAPPERVRRSTTCGFDPDGRLTKGPECKANRSWSRTPSRFPGGYGPARIAVDLLD